MSVPTASLGGTLGSVADADDIDRIFALRDFMQRERTGAVLSAILSPSLETDAWSLIIGHCRLVHAGLLVFPDNLEQFLGALPHHGLLPSAPIPSTVVRERVARRWMLDPSDVRIYIAHATIVGNESRDLELFMLPAGSPQVADSIAAVERTINSQSHFAVTVNKPSETIVRKLCQAIAISGGMTRDGGGINAHEGVSVFYFTRSGSVDGWPRRLELSVRGQYPSLVDMHLESTQRAGARSTDDGLASSDAAFE